MKRSLFALTIAVLIIILIAIISYIMAEVIVYLKNKEKIENVVKRNRAQSNNREQYNNSRSNTQQKHTYSHIQQEPVEKHTYKKRKSSKRYHRYSRYIKLKSDSKIKIMRDNRLTSNLPIYGSYKGILLSSPQCPKKRVHDLNMYNECYVSNIYNDKFYFKKELVNNFNVYRNNRTIECHYNKKHGIMQDCRI